MNFSYVKSFSIFILSLNIIGCAQVVPYNHSPTADDATLTVYRTNDFLVGGVGAQVKIDQQLIAKLYPGEFSIIKITQGEHQFSTNGVGYGGVDISYVFKAESQEELYIEIKPDPAMWGKALIPIVAMASNPFLFEKSSKTIFMNVDFEKKEIPVAYNSIKPKSIDKKEIITTSIDGKDSEGRVE